MPLRIRLCAVATAVLLMPAATAVAGEGNPDPGYGTKGVSLLPTGNADTSSGEAIVMQGDKAVIAGEAVEDIGGGVQRLRAAVTRANANGTRDTTFGVSGQRLVAAGTGDSQFFGVAAAPDGKLVAVGTAVNGGQEQVLVARFNANGALDATFDGDGIRLVPLGTGGVSAGNAVHVEPDGTVVVAGQALDGGVTKMLRFKLPANGGAVTWSQLTAIGADGVARANAIGKLGDGTFVVAGETADGDTLPFVARFSAANGVLTGDWGNQGNGISLLALDTVGGAYGMVVNGGQIVIAGAAVDGATQALAAAFLAGNGAVDTSFGTGGALRLTIGDGGTSVARAVTTDGAGRLVLAGRASQDVDGTSVFHFMTARITAAGALDTTYNPGASGSQPGTALAIAPGGEAAHGNGLAVRADGKAVLAGRVGDGPGESLATVRFCTAVAQPCFSASGDVALPPQSDIGMSEQCGSRSITGTADISVSGSYEGRVTVGVTSSNPSVYTVSPASQTVEAKRDGPLPVTYTVSHSGNAADSAVLTILVQPEGRAAFTRTLTVTNSVLSVSSITPATATTPRDRKPGSPVELTVPGLEICGTAGYTGAPSPLVRMGNDQALVRATRTGERLTAATSRLATTGPFEVVTLDAANAIVARAAATPAVTVDTYRNTFGFAFDNFAADPSFDDMLRAFGAEDMFVCIHVPFVGCVPSGVPDPWAVTVWTLLQFGNGSCFGISWVSEWMRQGKLSPATFTAGATNPFTIGGTPAKGDAPTVRPQNITDEVEAAWVRQFSEEYMSYYRSKTLANIVGQTPASLRGEIESMMARGEHPLISIRDGGSIAGLHVVTAYDIEDDPAQPGAYFIHVYDNNTPYDPAEITPAGDINSDRLGGTTFRFTGKVDSRIHVRADGSWAMPSSGFGGKQLANIIAGPWDLPPEDATILGPASSISTAVTLFVAWVGEGIANLRADGAPTDAPSSVTQITAGNKRLYSAPGVVNTNASTKLDVVPWTLATGGPAPVDGHLIPAGAPYEIELRGDRNATQTQALFGNDTVTKLTTPVTRGVTNKIAVQPKQNTVSVDPGVPSAKIKLEMSAQPKRGTWRTAALSTTTRGEDGLRYDRARDAYVIAHEGPATTVNLTLSSMDKTALPQEATARIRVGRNQTVSLKPRSWRKLGGGSLLVRSGGKTRRVKLRGTPASRLTMGTPTARVKGRTKTARVKVTVPKGAADGSAKLTYVVRRGKKRIAARTVSAGRPGRRTVTIRLPAATKRRDTLTVVGTALRPRGDRFTVATATKTTRVR